MTRMRSPSIAVAVTVVGLITTAHAVEPAYTAPGEMHSGARARVRKLDAETLQHAVTRHRRFVVMMHEGADATVRSFQPWLYAIANMMPHIPIGTIDVSRGRGAEVAEAFEVDSKGAPALKLFVRDNPKGKRIINYHGPLDFDALLGWMRAAVNEEEHEYSTYSAGPKGSDEYEDSVSSTASQASPMSRLPESVRAMAQTMVKETRLQRILKQHGGGRAEQYDAMVSEKYRQIIESEKTDMGDKFAVQEANRRARDEVRDEILAEAPLHVREEVEAEVNLGDAANSIGSAGGKSSGTAAKKPKKPKKTGPKQEL